MKRASPKGEVLFLLQHLVYTICCRLESKFMGTPERYTRGKDYRKTFFENKKGVFGSDVYLCAYCGRPIHKKKVTVDHLIPCHKVKHWGFGRLLMFMSGIRNVNDSKNLVAACHHCNSSKGSKMGFWLIRGMLGRHAFFWLFFWLLVFCILGLMIWQCWPLIIELVTQI